MVFDCPLISEPAPAVTDCWAQGSVPKLITPREPVIVEEEEEQDTQEMPEIKEEYVPLLSFAIF